MEYMPLLLIGAYGAVVFLAGMAWIHVKERKTRGSKETGSPKVPARDAQRLAH